MKTNLIILGGCLFGLGYFSGKIVEKPESKSPIEMESPTRTVLRAARPVVKEKAEAAPSSTQRLRLSNRRSLLGESMDIFQLNAEALEALIKDPKFDELGRSDSANAQLFSACFARLTEIDPERALMLADSLTSRQKMIALNAIYQEWASSDPDAALASTLQIKDARHQKMALNHTLKSISADDPGRAFELSQEHGKRHPTLYSTVYNIVSKMAEQDPLLALKAIENSNSKDIRKQGFTKSVLATWSRNEPDAVSAYVDQVSSDSQRKILTKDLIGVFSYIDAERSLDLLKTHVSSYELDDLQGALSNIAGENPNQLVEWIDSSYEGDDKEEMTLLAISSWSSDDSEGLQSYYDRMPESELKEQVNQSIQARNKRGGLSIQDHYLMGSGTRR